MTFRGWPAEAFDFYARLTLDNSREFWLANKPCYERAIREPFAAFSDAVAGDYGPMHLFRPNRDVRFSKDKSPYKTAAGAVTESEGGGSYYVQVSADGLFVGAGMYMMASDQLDRFRRAVAHDATGAEIAGIVAGLRGRRYEIGAMDALKTAPRGYAKDHPRIELLRLKGLTIGRAFPLAKWMHTPKALERILAVWSDASEMSSWLERRVGPSALAPPEPDF